MATVATLFVKLGLDSKGYSSGLREAIQKTGAAAQDIGKKLTNIGAGLTAGLTAPILAAGVAAGKMAVDLQESQNAVNVVFEDAADIMDAYGETVATTAGLSRAEFNQLGAVTGAFLKNVGFDTAQAADETIRLTERASDMASIFNTDVSQALEAIQSGLKGEFNPLEQFGVKLNAAAINARALEMGLADANGEISESAKAQAALALVMEQTDQFAGDFAATSDQLANATKIARAQFTDAAAALGTQLLPIGLRIVEWVSGLIEKFNALTPAQQKTILIIGAVVAAIGPLITIIGGLITAFGVIMPVISAVGAALLGPLGLAIAAIIAIGALLVVAWKKNWGDIQGKTQKAIDFIKRIIDIFRSAIQGDWFEFGQKLRSLWDDIWNAIQTAMRNAGTALNKTIKNIIGRILNFFRNTNWQSVGRDAVLGIGRGFTQWTGWLVGRARQVAHAALQAAKGFLGIGSPSKAFAELGKFSAIGFGKGFEDTMTKVEPQIALSLMPEAVLPNTSAFSPAGATQTESRSLVIENVTINNDMDLQQFQDMLRSSLNG